MKNAVFLLTLTMVFAGCVELDSAAVPDSSIDVNGRHWTDEELVDQVNPEFNTEDSPEAPQILLDTPEAWGAPGAVTITGAVSRESAVFLFVIGEACNDFSSRSERLIFNGTWSHEILDLPMGQYYLFAYAFGHDADGFLDTSVGSTLGRTADQDRFRRGYEATISIDYGPAGREGVEGDVVQIWEMAAYDSYPSTNEEHPCQKTSHPDYLNIHDVLVAWEAQHNHQVTYSYNSGFSSFSVDRIDGEGNGLGAGEPPWWCYSINGSSQGVQGISLQRFNDGDEIHWVLGTCDGVGLAPAAI